MKCCVGMLTGVSSPVVLGTLGAIAECPQFGLDRGLAKVRSCLNIVEPGTAQRRFDELRISKRIGQRSRIRIPRIRNDQRDAPGQALPQPAFKASCTWRSTGPHSSGPGWRRMRADGYQGMVSLLMP